LSVIPNQIICLRPLFPFCRCFVEFFSLFKVDKVFDVIGENGRGFGISNHPKMRRKREGGKRDNWDIRVLYIEIEFNASQLRCYVKLFVFLNSVRKTNNQQKSNQRG